MASEILTAADIQVKLVQLTCVRSNGTAHLIFAGRIIWTGNPAELIQANEVEATQIFRDFEAGRAFVENEQRKADERRAWNKRLNHEIMKALSRIWQIHNADPWKIKATTWAKILKHRRKAVVRNKIVRTNRGSKQRKPDCTWYIGLQYALSALRQRMKWRADIWRRWADGRAASWRSKMNWKRGLVKKGFCDDKGRNNSKTVNGNDQKTEPQMRFEWS